jgi:hypothetical protein
MLGRARAEGPSAGRSGRCETAGAGTTAMRPAPTVVRVVQGQGVHRAGEAVGVRQLVQAVGDVRAANALRVLRGQAEEGVLALAATGLAGRNRPCFRVRDDAVSELIYIEAAQVRRCLRATEQRVHERQQQCGPPRAAAARGVHDRVLEHQIIPQNDDGPAARAALYIGARAETAETAGAASAGRGARVQPRVAGWPGERAPDTAANVHALGCAGSCLQSINWGCGVAGPYRYAVCASCSNLFTVFNAAVRIG